MAKRVFACIWEYDVKDEHQDAFEHTYGPEGEWVLFFSSSNAYMGTELHKDLTQPSRFITIDYWTNKSARDKFQKLHASEYKKIDQSCEAFTLSEKLIGEFECFYKNS